MILVAKHRLRVTAITLVIFCPSAALLRPSEGDVARALHGNEMVRYVISLKFNDMHMCTVHWYEK